MATVRLSDAVIPAVYDSYRAVDNAETTAFWNSGVVARSDTLDAYADAPGLITTIPFWNDIDPAIEPNYSNDDPADYAVPNKIGSGQQVVGKAFVNQAFAAMDLTQELAGSNPMQRIKNRFGVYWTRQLQRRMIAAALGVFNDNVADDASDMVIDISIEDGNAATSANLFSRAAFVNASFTLGDQVGGIRAIAVHSVVMKRMVNNDDIDFIPDSQGALTIPTYLGRFVIVDDNMPVIAGGTSGYRYVSMLFGGAAFLFGNGTPVVPSEVTREPLAGNGGGEEIIIERREWIIHPNGFSWNAAAVLTELSPTLADLRLAANWDRIVPRKNARVAFLVTNG